MLYRSASALLFIFFLLSVLTAQTGAKIFLNWQFYFIHFQFCQDSWVLFSPHESELLIEGETPLPETNRETSGFSFL